MITSFKEFSGLFSVKIDNKIMYFKLNYDENLLPFEINIIYDNKNYNNLSIIIPDSKKLGYKEFFLNPEIQTNIINTLIEENFIDQTNFISVAGDEETKSYKLII